MNNPPFAEVIESSLTGWLAQSWEWDTFPSFGSLVTISQNNRTFIGVIYQIKTGSLDPMRYPFAYKKSEEELKKEQPQIFEFLKTTVSCLTMGYKENKGNKEIRYHLAAEPPKIHSFVHSASPSLYQDFFSNKQYLHLLFNCSSLPISLDELLLAMFHASAPYYTQQHHDIIEMTHLFNLLTGNDYRRLKLFLQRIQTLLL